MAAINRFFRRLANAVRPNRRDADLDRELAAHLQLIEDDHVRRGVPRDDARRRARLALGGVEQTKERHRDARAFRWVDDLRRDAVYAARVLRRQPIATAVAVLSLAAGIGLNAAVFSVVDWVLLRPLPYPAPEELVRVFTAGTAPVTSPGPLTYDEFRAFGAAQAFRAATAFTTATRTIRGAGVEPSHVVVARVAGDPFATFGVVPEIGRTFAADELSSGAPVVVLSHGVWQRRFAGDRAIAGRTVAIDGAPFTVIGVLPRGRGYPADADLWRPLTAGEREGDDRELSMVGRLQGGTTQGRALAELTALARATSKGARTASIEDVQQTGVRDVGGVLRVIFAAAMLTLLIACANVAAMVGARGADRAREMAVRGALGATRARVVAQLVTESVLLAAMGGVLGLIVGQWALRVLVAAAPVAMPRLADIALDGRILAIGAAATLATGLAVGLIPALRLSRVTETAGLGRVPGLQARSGRRALVLAQVALAVVLTAGAGLLTRSLQRLVRTDHGFSAERLVAVELYLRGVPLENLRPLFRTLVESASAVPGVEAVAIAARLPTQQAFLRTSAHVIGERDLPSPATLRPVSASYFDTVGIPLAAGRPFAAADTTRAPRVAIANTAFVRDLLGGRGAVGLRLATELAGEVTIVGVAGDVTPAGIPDRPALYVPTEQLVVGGAAQLLVRATGDPRSIVPALTGRVRAAAPGLALDRVRRVAELLEESRAVTRFSTQVAAAFAGLSFFLAMIGVYGLTAGDVAARWREIAVRMALGASHRDVLWTVIRPCAALLGAGAAIGVAAAAGTGPTLASMVQGVAAADAPTLVAAPLILAGVGVLAAALAARRVLRADPAATLRGE